MNLNSSYITNIKEYKALTKEQEKTLYERMSTDPSVKDEIISMNLRLVLCIARRYENMGLDIEDLIQEGNMGLIHAVEKYDYTKDNTFSTYAAFWIRAYIFRALDKETKLTKGFSSKNYLLYKEFLSVEKALLQQLNRYPTDKEIADAMNIEEAQVSEIKSHGRIASIDEINEDEDREIPFEIEDPTNMEDEIIHANTDMFGKAFAMLTEKELIVIKKRMGFDGNEPESLVAIGKELGISKQRVLQLERSAINKLRKYQHLIDVN